MAGWHHRCNGHELGKTSGDGEGQRPGMLQSMGSPKNQTRLCDLIAHLSTYTHRHTQMTTWN